MGIIRKNKGYFEYIGFFVLRNEYEIFQITHRFPFEPIFPAQNPKINHTQVRLSLFSPSKKDIHEDHDIFQFYKSFINQCDKFKAENNLMKRKLTPKQTLQLKKQKPITQYIQGLESDENEQNRESKPSIKSIHDNDKTPHRQSDNIKKITHAYGGNTARSDHRSYTKSTFMQRKNETEALTKNYNSKKQEKNEESSDSKSTEFLQINKLNINLTKEALNQFSLESSSLHGKLNGKFQSIEPRQVRIESKRKQTLPISNSSSEFLIQESPHKALSLKPSSIPKSSSVQQTTQKQKLKQLYDKVRNPVSQATQIRPTQKIEQNEEIIQPRTTSRHKSQNQTQYLSKITGKSRGRIQDQRITSTQQLLSGKVSIIWLFAIKANLPSQIQTRITDMYNPILQDDRAVPLLTNPKRIQQYVNIPNCYFKIVTDIECAQKAIGFRIYSKVIEFHIWNNGGNDTLLKALEYKNVTRKVKGIFTDWQKLMYRAQDEIEQQIAIYRVNNGLQKRKRQRKFPNFLKLTDTDKTDATLYRINLYGAIKLLPQEKKQHYDNFMQLVLAKYDQKQSQTKNIHDYIKIDHQKPVMSLQQAQLIIQFYVRESFYYQIVNSMLRTMKTSQQFKPCMLPFNQTYHAIKLYYMDYLQRQNGQVPEITLYRGCKLSKKDSRCLKPGAFIQMFGFMSTSKSESRALEFVDRDGYLFVIHVNKRKANQQRFKNFDHGFVDINRYGLASPQYSHQQQVLFNALNVYQVLRIQQKDNYKYIHLQYGVIFDLLQKQKQHLSQDEYETLVNYHYCTRIQGKIEDQGDVFVFANELVEAKQYYDKKIKQGTNLAHNYYKLAGVQKQCGEIDQAEKNANQALILLGDQIDLNDRQKCLKVFGIHSQNAQINLQKQDYLTADDQIDKAMSMLSDDEIFQRAMMLRQRGQIKFKKGEIKNAQSDFDQSESIFQNLKDEGKVRKISAYKTYYLGHLSLFCTNRTRVDLKNDLKQQLKKVQELQNKISQMNDTIQDQLIRINKSLKDVSLYVQDRQRYQIEVKKAQSYLYSLKARKANDPQLRAKLLTMQAMINDYQQLAQTEKLMNEAIELIQAKNPFDMKVADYSKILAKMQKAELEKYTNPPKKLLNQKPTVPIAYDQYGRKQIYERCKRNFTKTLNVLLFHAKDKASPEILDIRNQLGELTFGENDYVQCERILNEARGGNHKLMHSQMSKTLVIMAKISFARGQLKHAFQTLKQAHRVLQQAMVNKHQKQKQHKNLQKYRNIFQNSDTYLTIQFIRVNIYHKQRNHDLALKNIDEIHSIIVKKVGVNDSHPMLAELLELKGSSEVFMGRVYQFDEYFQKAIILRQKQFGFYHPVNAKTCCAYAKYLIMVKDIKRAQQMLQKAVEIISAFEQTNPHYWAMYYSQGYFNEELNQLDKSQAYYQKSLQWSQKYFNKSHIAIKQVMLRYANSLSKSKKLQQSMKVYELLQEELDQELRQSNIRQEVNQEGDDEKVSLKKLMYSQLSELELDVVGEDEGRNQSYIKTTHTQLVNTSLYKSKLMLLRNTYKIPTGNISPSINNSEVMD